MKYEDQIAFKQQKYREWFRLFAPTRKAKRRPLIDDEQAWMALIRLDSKRIQREKKQKRLKILGPRHYRITIDSSDK